MQTPNNDVRLLGLRALVLDLVLTSGHASAEEKLICSGRVANCQNPEVLLKWYTNTLRLLAEREEAAPALNIRHIAGYGVPYNGNSTDSFLACPEFYLADNLLWEHSSKFRKLCRAQAPASIYNLRESKAYAFSLPNN